MNGNQYQRNEVFPMKRWLTIILCLLMVVGMAACGNEKEPIDNSTPTTGNEEQGHLDYAADPLINRFFNELIAAFPKAMDPFSIRRATGSANTDPADLTKEYHAVIGECNVTVRNVSYNVTPDNGDKPYTVQQLRLFIEGGTTEKQRDKMMNAFSQIVKTIDTGCSDARLAEAVAHMEAQTQILTDYRFTNYVKVERYVPIVKEHGVPCRIDLLTINYQVAEK